MRKPKSGTGKVNKRLVGRNLAAFMLVKGHMDELPDAERRRRAMKALRLLASDDLARFTESEIEEARQTLIAMMGSVKKL